MMEERLATLLDTLPVVSPFDHGEGNPAPITDTVELRYGFICGWRACMDAVMVKCVTLIRDIDG